MTTQNTQTTTPAPAAQGSHFWVLTLELPGRAAMTQSGAYTPPAGMTRNDVYLALRQHVTADHPEMARATTMFFALEPNQL
ncbi:hypothetical protein [Streptomyces goshikiensis]|uniref:hypothetical protein n=1 Tax=Streptomyces goshikiensis TaxID=1942 RepID=UPI002E130346|nr:hypothetical protein OG224_16945 [Streptomyces goshikiensis]